MSDNDKIWVDIIGFDYPAREVIVNILGSNGVVKARLGCISDDTFREIERKYRNGVRKQSLKLLRGFIVPARARGRIQ